MNPIFVGQIILWSGTWIPEGCFPCDGRSLSNATYKLLYSIIGNTYGGTSPTFNLPNLQGLALAGTGEGPNLSQDYIMGANVGSPTVQINNSTMPSHNHGTMLNASTAVTATVQVSADPASTATPTPALVPAAGFSPDTDNIEVDLYGPQSNTIGLVNGVQLGVTASIGSLALADAGANTPHNNMQPYLPVYYIIAWTGIFPSFDN